jgi:hypothetical protein
VIIRYDPQDMAEIRVFTGAGFLCRAICPELAGTTVSLKDITAARNARRRVEGPPVRLGLRLVGSGALRGHRHLERRADQVGGLVPEFVGTVRHRADRYGGGDCGQHAGGLGPRPHLAVCLLQPLRERRVQALHHGGPGDYRLIGHVPACAEGQRKVLLTPAARCARISGYFCPQSPGVKKGGQQVE